MRLAARFATPDDIDGGDGGAGPRTILGVIGFSAERPARLEADCPFLSLPLASLPNPTAAARPLEVWSGTGTRERLDRDGLVLAHAGDALLGMVRVPVSQWADLAMAARDLYARIFAACGACGCPNLLRVFHYLPRITGCDADGRQRYHAFNVGRHAAFAAAGRVAERAPAASALGIPASGDAAGDAIWVYFLASADPGKPIENARQTSAYRYPPRHGPRSPIFSRATISDPAGAPLLLVSGTASIVAHESRHAGDVGAQTDEIIRNLAALQDGCGASGLVPVGPMSLKVYLRRPADLRTVAAHLDAAGLTSGAGRLFLHADICRDELLVEVEATCPMGLRPFLAD